MDFFSIWKYLIPPLAGAIIGYFTNDIAISMLFRPYEAKFIGKTRIPFTPGLIPANQPRLAQKVSDAIMSSLLTPDELHKLAKRLLQIERVQAAITWLLQIALKQLKEESQEKTAKVVSNVLKDLFIDTLPRLIKALARKETFLEEQINQIFDKVILEFHLNDTQARQLSDWLLDKLIPANTLRKGIIEFLSERNIQVIDEIFREKTRGTYWVVVNLFGLKNTLIQLKTFCIEEHELANTRLQELILSIEIRGKVRKWLKTSTIGDLPTDTIRQLRKNTQEVVRLYLQEKGNTILEKLGTSIDWDKLANLLIKQIRASTALAESVEIISQELALILEKYLEEDLEKIVEEAIPILSIDQVIISRVIATSPQNLELAIQDIVKNELQAIVNLGGILGLIVGILQSILMVFTNSL